EKKELLNKDSEAYQKLQTHLLSGKPLLGESSPFSDLLQGMVNTIMEGEMDAFLDEEKAANRPNNRNGKQRSRKVQSSVGPVQVDAPRDRRGQFESDLLGKRQGVLNTGLDDQILALYAQGNSYEDIRRLLRRMFGVSISAGKLSAVTDKVLPLIEEWRTRVLSAFYPVIYLDAIHFKIRHEGRYSQRASYTVYGIDGEGQRDLLGLYVLEHEGATRWRTVLEDLKRRGVEDVMVFCTDDLSGLSEVMTDEFSGAVVQKCIVHAVRASLKTVDEKDRKFLAKGLRNIYTAPDRQAARVALDTNRATWDKKYHRICDKWERQWGELLAFMDFPRGMRKMIYTTNPVEALHRIIRKLVKSKAAWVSDTALIKQMYMSLMYNEKSWRRKAHGWREVQRAIIELYPERAEKYF
ncbi:MAG: IS256 family transposase, partial [Bacteroidota bacterium]